MNPLSRFTVITIFLAGLVTVGILGTSTSMSFVWPGYLIIGLAGVTSVIAIFRRTRFSIPGWCLGAVFITAGYVMIRAVESPVAYFAREDSALVITCFIVYAVFLSILDEARWRNALFWCIVGLLSLNCLVAIIQWIGGSELWFLSGHPRSFPDRIAGLFRHPDHFAGFLALGISFVFSSIIFAGHSRRIRIGLAILSLVCLLEIILAKSLLGLVGLCFGMSIVGLTVALLSWKRMGPEIRKSLVWGIASSAVMLAGFLSFNASRVEQIVSQNILQRGGQISLIDTWQSSIEQFSEAPLAGTGSRTFYFFSRKFRPEEEGAAAFESEFVHNEYLQVLADYGILGLLTVLSLLVLHYGNGVRFVTGYTRFETGPGNLVPKSKHLALATGSLASIGTVAFLAIFDFVLHVPAIALITTVMLGILACPDPMSKVLTDDADEFIPGGGFLFVGRGLAFGCGVALTFFSFMFSKSEWHLEMARNSFEAGHIDAEQLEHLAAARKIDPFNPFAISLSAHSYVKAIQPEMAEPVRIAYLEKAEQYFEKSRVLYPRDISGALAHGMVLDALGRNDEARARIREAREWAPHHANLMIARGEHFLRLGDYAKAERAFLEARRSSNHSRNDTIEEGLEWIARSKHDAGGGTVGQRAGKRMTGLKLGSVREVEFSGSVERAIQKSIRKLENQLDAKLREELAKEAK